MSQKWLFSLCFAFCDVRVTKMQSSPNVGHKMYSVTKTCVFVTNFVTILVMSLICDTHFSSLPSPKNVMKSMPWLTMQVPCRTEKVTKIVYCQRGDDQDMMWLTLCDDLIRHKTMNGPTKPIWIALYFELNCRPITFTHVDHFYINLAHLHILQPILHSTHSSFNPLQTLQP